MIRAERRIVAQLQRDLHHGRILHRFAQAVYFVNERLVLLALKSIVPKTVRERTRV